MEKRKEIDILGVNILYFVTAMLLLTVGYYVQNKDLKMGLVITEYVLVLLPPLIYIKLKGYGFKRVLRLNPLSIKHSLIVIAITILVYPIALFFNLIVMTFISTIGKIQSPPIPTANNITEYFILMVIIAMSAGICEEIFFRGLVLRGYEELGSIHAVVISSLLFGLFHFNIQNFAGPVVLGLVFGYLVYRTGSLFAGMIGHMTNNGIAVTLGFLMNLVKDQLPQSNMDTMSQIPNTLSLSVATIFVGVIATITGIGAYFLLRIIIKDTKNRKENRDIEDIRLEKEDESIEISNKTSIYVFTPILLTVIIFIYVAYSQLKYMMLQ
ncbi:type II CAAX endopeptidase family protein [Marinisporobacter balticus]|uniref:CAAX prenyl protease 2/Lysostaphin resistance protein A-like domain-containing protein n=1 Tax=Marinisporobacter balticus TaxID=2018667 RepID=A0A4R2KL91_9FIRM|nr:type II CAAX endopeptidase family protein [Marinisporobacter balticus]TCO71469.1 hypothetical protein EV214_12119 [Marinisporobacter balticus]